MISDEKPPPYGMTVARYGKYLAALSEDGHDKTMRQAITSYLERLPSSEWGNCGPIADVILPGVDRGWQRVLNELWRMDGAGLVTFKGHTGWRLRDV